MVDLLDDTLTHNVEVADGDLVVSLAYVRFGNKEYYNSDHFVEPDDLILSSPYCSPPPRSGPRERCDSEEMINLEGKCEEGGAASSSMSNDMGNTDSTSAEGTTTIGKEQNINAEGEAVVESSLSGTWRDQMQAQIQAEGKQKRRSDSPNIKLKLFSDEEDEGEEPERRIKSAAEREREANRLRREELLPKVPTPARNNLNRAITPVRSRADSIQQPNGSQPLNSPRMSPPRNSPPRGSPLRISPRLLQNEDPQNPMISTEVSQLKLKHTTTRMNWLFYKAVDAEETVEKKKTAAKDIPDFAKMGSLKKIKAADFDEENLMVELVFPPTSLVRQGSAASVPGSALKSPAPRGRSPAPTVRRGEIDGDAPKSPAPVPAGAASSSAQSPAPRGVIGSALRSQRGVTPTPSGKDKRLGTPASRRTPLARHLVNASTKRRRLLDGEGVNSGLINNGLAGSEKGLPPKSSEVEVDENDTVGMFLEFLSPQLAVIVIKVCSLLFLTLFDFAIFRESIITKKNPFTDKTSEFHMDDDELEDFAVSVTKKSGADKWKRKGITRVLVKGHCRRGHRVMPHYRKVKVNEDYNNKKNQNWTKLFE